jgi:hypothetical protein
MIVGESVLFSSWPEITDTYNISSSEKTNNSLRLSIPWPRLWNSDNSPQDSDLANHSQFRASIDEFYQFTPFNIDSSNMDPTSSEDPDDFNSTGDFDPTSDFGPTSDSLDGTLYMLGLVAGESYTIQQLSSITDWVNFADYDKVPIGGVLSPLVGLSSISINPDAVSAEDSVTEALECALTLCVNEYDVQVQSGKLSTSIKSTDYVQISQGDYYDEFNATGTAWVDGHLYTVNGSALLFMLDSLVDALTGSVGVHQAFRYFFEYLAGDVQIDAPLSFDPDTSVPYFSNHSNIISDGLTYDTYEVFAIRKHGNLSQTLENVAASLNYHLQKYATDQVSGKVLIHETYVCVRWAWLVLPLFLIVLGMLALLLTIWQTRQREAILWKSSSLPLLYRGPAGLMSRPDSFGDMQNSRRNTIAAMHADAKNFRVRLLREHETGEWTLK